MKLWGGRFTQETDPQFASFNSSFHFDRRLLDADLRACRAHTRALGRAGILSSPDVEQLCGAIVRLQELCSDPAFVTRREFADAEDVHSFIESRLFEIVGSLAQRLHTGRSRNDQVAVATRLFLRGETDRIDTLLVDVERALVELAERNIESALPGYTHLQKAQPILFAHFLLAYFEMIERDRERLRELRSRVNRLPLGSGAIAGTGFPVNRELIAEELGFEGVTRNSIDAVSDRDYIIEFVAAAALMMVHLSRLAEDLIIYSTQEFAFIKLGDAIATGSSLMPQKKNPDSLELVRGKAARVIGHATALLTLVKGLPLAYNKDLQEDKEALFDTIDTLSASLQVTAIVIRNIEFDARRAGEKAATDYTNATDLADYLVKRGLEFRKAHEIVGRVIVFALEQGRELAALTIDEYRKFSDLFSEDLFEALSLKNSLASKSETGGTSPARVKEEIIRARRIIDEVTSELAD
jgi:argininosuccinate lyase